MLREEISAVMSLFLFALLQSCCKYTKNIKLHTFVSEFFMIILHRPDGWHTLDFADLLRNSQTQIKMDEDPLLRNGLSSMPFVQDHNL